MKVKTLLNKAKKCKSEQEVNVLLQNCMKKFMAFVKFKRLTTHNEEAYIEDGKPFFRFEIARVFSNEYILMMRPEICDGEFKVLIELDRMLDKRGTDSQNWETVEDTDEFITPDEDETIKSICESIFEQAIEIHANLIESVGVSHSFSRQIALTEW